SCLRMDSQSIKNARAAANIHFAVSLLQEGIDALLKRHCGLQQQPDFNTCLQMLETQIAKLLPDASSQDQLLKTMQLARATRNRYSHQEFDVNRFEHDVECLLKLASLLGLTECREQIMSFTGSVGTSGEDWEKLKIEGNEHYKNSRWTEAMNCYTGAICINSTQAILYSNRALCEIQLRKFDLAREDAEEAIVLNPKQVKFYRTLSEALCNLQLFEEAVAACKDGLKIDPRDETLLVRSRDCQALVVDAEIKEHPVFGGAEQIRNPDAFKYNLQTTIENSKSSDYSPADVGTMDSAMRKMMLDVRKAHLILLSGRGKVLEEQKALEIFKSTANRGSAEGLYNMALMHKDGMAGLSRNPERYLELCRRTAEQKPYLKLEGSNTVLANIGVAEAENSIAMAYRDGFTVDQDDKLAFQWFLKSAEHGCASAMNNLGIALYNGSGCKQNFESARWWYEKSANLGQSEGQVNLAKMLITGVGGPEDPLKAADLLKSAAAQGLPDALFLLQQLQVSGTLGGKSFDSSKAVIQDLAASNNKQALFLMGMNYMTGEGGLAKNLAEAEKYLRQASILDHKEATFELGNLLLQQKRNEDAVVFIKRAASSGIKDAQQTYGHLLALGHGCARDVTEARRWLLRSKESKDSVDNFIQQSQSVVEFESAQNLSLSGFTYSERITRYLESRLPNPKAARVVNEMSSIFKRRAENPIHPSAPTGFRFAIPLMLDRAAKGSKTAQQFFTGLKLVDDLRSALDSNNTSEAFVLFRQIDRIWQPLLLDSETLENLFSVARKAFESNPKDSEALFVILHYNSCVYKRSNAELLSMALQCATLNPNIAEYHNILGCMYGFNGDFVSSLRSIEQALELDRNPAWLYN
ncbi:hypothetical protein BOX15_Mlig016935g1, partial [Macrostomum lignano]